jgi:4-hydroxy-2-oxoheptanedioate aldolase
MSSTIPTNRVPNDRPNTGLKALWRANVGAAGVWISLADPVTAELIARRGFDYLVIDMQHGVAGPDTMASLVRAVSGTATEVLLRVPWNEPAMIMRALDLGAAGVIVPLVNTADDARAAVAACRFPPDGMRSWGPWRAGIEGRVVVPAEANRDTICVVMVETELAMRNLDEIVAVPGIDAVYIGPNDLALGLGEGRATYKESKVVYDAILKVLEACQRGHVVAGLHCSSPEMAIEWRKAGFQMLTTAEDVTLLKAAADVVVRDVIDHGER